ncbi:MAG: zinc ribbon domain-containing protein [Myxococcota bacterium]
MMNRLRATAPRSMLISGVRWGLLAVMLYWTATASAQHPGVPGSAPPPPSGPGNLTVQVVHETNPAETEGITIALYALSPDGSPGLASTVTDSGGTARFSDLATNPDIVYLVGARYQDIPFGERVTFAAGEAHAQVEIIIISPSEETSHVRIEEMRLRLDWMGDQIVVHERLRVKNSGPNVIRLSETAGERSIVARRLTPDVRDFSSGPNGIDEGITFEDGTVRFSGPLYPGEQDIEYRYSLPLPSEHDRFRIPIELSLTTPQLVVVAGTVGLKIDGPGFVPSNASLSDSDRSLKAFAHGELVAGEVVELKLSLPDSRRGRAFLTIPRSDIWIEIDDTQLTANIEIEIEIAPGAPVAGTLEAPLLSISIPEGATLQGVAPEAEALGLNPRDHGGFDVLGPIGPGKTSLSYAYRMPAGPEGVQLGMRFPAEVQTLNVLIADTGLALDSRRLHRRRPFRSGKRNYLHREAFNISPSEIVDLELVPIRTVGFSRNTVIGFTIAAAAAGAFFLFAPLRTTSRREPPGQSPAAAIRAQREAVYTAIRDLDHDFETAKLEDHDYQQMRSRLRAEAIALLRAERETDAKPSSKSDAEPQTSVNPVTTSVFCPGCGGNVAATWRFCSHCGGDLNPLEEAGG